MRSNRQQCLPGRGGGLGLRQGQGDAYLSAVLAFYNEKQDGIVLRA